MTKKESKANKPTAKKEKNSNGMGRVVFYSIALIVACCAVAVVLFETETGQKLVAKVRGKESSNTRSSTRAHVKNTARKQPEAQQSQAGGESKKTNQAESALPRDGSVLSKDTSAKPTAKSNDAKRDESKQEDIGEESVAGESGFQSAGEREGDHGNEADIQMDESTLNMDSGEPTENNDEWEKLVEEMNRDEPVKEQEKPIEEQEKPIEEQDIPVVKMEKPNMTQEEPIEGQREEKEIIIEKPEKPNDERDKEGGDLQEEIDLKEDGKTEKTEQHGVDEIHEHEERKEEVVEEKVNEEDGGETGEEESLSVGDSLAELEKVRAEENMQAKKEKRIQEERYEPISEPEGPPIDLSPVNARRGLRGDYGGKGTVFFIYLCIYLTLSIPSGTLFLSTEITLFSLQSC